MLYYSTFLLGLASTALAQSSPTLAIPTNLASFTNSAPRPTSTGTTGSSLPELVAQIPRCAASCLSRAATDIKCNGPADFGCLCQSGDKLYQSVGLCLPFNGCSGDDISKVTNLAPQICVAWGQNRDNPAALASGTSAVSSLASAAGVQTGTTPNVAGPVRTGAPLAAVIGAAGAWAVMAL